MSLLVRCLEVPLAIKSPVATEGLTKKLGACSAITRTKAASRATLRLTNPEAFNFSPPTKT